MAQVLDVEIAVPDGTRPCGCNRLDLVLRNTDQQCGKA
jgi:hypothetical protein